MSLPQILYRSIHDRGWSGTVSRVVERSMETVSERLYDMRHGIDTSGQVPCTRHHRATGDIGKGYRGTAPEFLLRRSSAACGSH